MKMERNLCLLSFCILKFEKNIEDMINIVLFGLTVSIDAMRRQYVTFFHEQEPGL